VRALRAVVFATLVFAAAGCAGGGEEDGTAPPRAVTTKASLTPGTHLFAEPVVARLDVVVDGETVDPDQVAVETDFAPYEVLGAKRTSEDFGRLTRLRHEFTLRCLLIACIPEILQSAAGEAETGRGERTTIRLPAATIAYDDPEEGERSVSVPWPPLESVSRITASEIPEFGFVFKTSVTPVAAPTYRVPPAVLAGALLLGALALLALPVWLLVGWARSRRPPPAVEAPELSPLERALALVEWANGRQNGAERREALEVLAVRLELVESGSLASRARALAWSPASPSRETATALVAAVRESNASE
jgi:hypothetical protein